MPNFTRWALGLCVLLSCSSLAIAADEQSPLRAGSEQEPLRRAAISFSETWHILGPFKTGTRETPWAPDPLDSYGGFANVTYDPEAAFPSALGLDSLVRWTTSSADELVSEEGYAKAALIIGFDEIDWKFLQSAYGWPALQYEAWARGNVSITSSSDATVAIYTPGLLEIWIDKVPYFGGDFYSYHRAPLLLTLAPGAHVVELRLVRDVRAFGASEDPRVSAAVEFKQMTPELFVDPGSVLVSELVDGRLASPFASVTMLNPTDAWVEVLSIQADGSTGPNLSLLDELIAIGPSQTRPLGFRVDQLPDKVSTIVFEISYRRYGELRIERSQPVGVELEERSIGDAQRFTFRHPSGIVSYAVLRPPVNQSCNVPEGRELPVLLSLHGAGLEADSELVRHMLDEAYGICAWILFPTGGTPWSGDDWHTWGFADVHAAVASIRDWMKRVEWDGPQVALDDWIVSGHSNGGQGTWFLLSHQPDKVLAAAPVSGYSSIENYVPYTMWQNSEPSLASVFDAARRSFKHEMLVPNFAGIPVYQQHGSEDDNVPAYNSRLMYQLIRESGGHSTYIELPGRGHWFEGVLTTEPLIEFYHLHASRSWPDTNTLPVEFSFVVPASADMGSKGGIFVDQLQSPDRYGNIHVVRDEEYVVWKMKTRNIRRLHLVPLAMKAVYPMQIILDDSPEPFVILPDEAETTWLVRSDLGQWEMSRNGNWKSLSQRYGRQVGAMDAVLRTTGPIKIVSRSPAADNAALQISRNLFQYFAADSGILSTATPTSDPSSILNVSLGNVITVTLGDDLPPSQLEDFPVRLEGDRLVVGSLSSDKTGGMEGVYDFEPGLGAAFLRPLPHERLELVLWGVDQAGLQRAARLVPTLTGAGQPDFVVVCFRCRWKSRGGIYAAGFFDHSWQISQGSYVS